MFDQAKAEQVLERVAGGESASKACRELAVNHATFYRHLESNQALRDNYARAQIVRAEVKADEVEDLADQVATGKLDPQAGRVAIDAKKWAAAILNRSKYGDKAALELTGANGADLFAGMSKVELQAELVRRISNPELVRALQAAGVSVAALPGTATKGSKG